MKSTAEQMYSIMKEARKKIDGIATIHSPDSATAIVENILSLMDGFDSITGNTRTGIAVGAYLNGKIQCVVTSKEIYGEEALMAQLRKGQKYPFAFAWGGGTMAKEYSGETQTKGRYSSKEAVEFLRRKIPRHKNGWAFIAVSAADYSNYIETAKKGNILTATRDMLLSMGASVTDVMTAK